MTRRMAGTICLSIGVTNRHPKILHRSVTITHPQTAISSPHQVAIYTGPFYSSLPTNYHTGPNTSKQFHFEAIIIPQQRSVGVFCHRKDFGADSERASEQVPDEVPQRIWRRCGKRFRSSFRRRFRGRFQRRFGRRLRGRSMRRFWRRFRSRFESRQGSRGGLAQRRDFPSGASCCWGLYLRLCH